LARKVAEEGLISDMETAVAPSLFQRGRRNATNAPKQYRNSQGRWTTANELTKPLPSAMELYSGGGDGGSGGRDWRKLFGGAAGTVAVGTGGVAVKYMADEKAERQRALAKAAEEAERRAIEKENEEYREERPNVDPKLIEESERLLATIKRETEAAEDKPGILGSFMRGVKKGREDPFISHGDEKLKTAANKISTTARELAETKLKEAKKDAAERGRELPGQLRHTGQQIRTNIGAGGTWLVNAAKEVGSRVRNSLKGERGDKFRQRKSKGSKKRRSGRKNSKRSRRKNSKRSKKRRSGRKNSKRSKKRNSRKR